MSKLVSLDGAFQILNLCPNTISSGIPYIFDNTGRFIYLCHRMKRDLLICETFATDSKKIYRVIYLEVH